MNEHLRTALTAILARAVATCEREGFGAEDTDDMIAIRELAERALQQPAASSGECDATLTAGDLHAAAKACWCQATMHETQHRGSGAAWQALGDMLLTVAERHGCLSTPQAYASLLLRRPDGTSAAASSGEAHHKLIEAAEFAAGAILDAIGLEDGLDGQAGHRVLGMLRDALVAVGHPLPDGFIPQTEEDERQYTDTVTRLAASSGEAEPTVVAGPFPLCRCPPGTCYLHPSLTTCSLRDGKPIPQRSSGEAERLAKALEAAADAIDSRLRGAMAGESQTAHESDCVVSYMREAAALLRQQATELRALQAKEPAASSGEATLKPLGLRCAFTAGWDAAKRDSNAGPEEDVADAADVAFGEWTRKRDGAEPPSPAASRGVRALLAVLAAAARAGGTW